MKKSISWFLKTTINIGVLIGAIGCARYEAKPLQLEAVNHKWNSMNPDRVLEESQSNDVAESLDGVFLIRDGISLKEAQAIALFFNPQLRVGRLRSGVPEVEQRYAKLWEDPSLDVDGERLINSLKEDLVMSTRLSVTIPLTGRKSSEKDKARLEHKAALSKLLDQEFIVLCQLKQAWGKLALMKQKEKAYRDLSESLDDMLKSVPRLIASGQFSTAGERYLRIRKEICLENLRAFETEAELIHLELLSLMGLNPNYRWLMQVDLKELDEMLNKDQDELMVLDHPEVMYQMYRYQVAEKELDLEIKKQIPDIRLGLGVGKEDGASRLKFGLGLLSLPLWNANKQGIELAEREREKINLEVEASVQKWRFKIERLKKEVSSAKSRCDHFEKTIFPMHEEQLEDVKKLIAIGKLDLTTLSDTLNDLMESQDKYSDLYEKMLMSHIELFMIKKASQTVGGNK